MSGIETRIEDRVSNSSKNDMFLTRSDELQEQGTDDGRLNNKQEQTAAAAAAAAAATPQEEVSSSSFMVMNGSGGPRDNISTDDGSSAALSNGPYQVIEYDPYDSEIMAGLEEAPLTIEDNTPAAEAIRANANVRVSTFGKAARAVHMQSLRRFVKKATGTTKSGVVRGKPPRIPEAEATSSDMMVPSLVCPAGAVGSGGAAGLDTVLEQADDDDDNDDIDDVDLDEEEESDIFITDTTTKTKTTPTKKKPPPPSSKIPQILDEDHIPDTVVAGTVEASKKVLGAVDPHDLLKLLRWKKKRKGAAGGGKVTKSYVKGKVIDGEHELYTLSIAVMIGVRTSISKTNAIINEGNGKRWVKIEDFAKTEKYEFRPKGGGLTPPHQLSHTFKVKDYAPVAFAYLRRLAGINEFDFLLSVCGNANFIEFISNAKSGQFFFYSSDGRYMIKTMTNDESRFLRRMLPSYFRHCVENPNTMMTRFLGMYRVKLYHLRRNVKFVIMNSVYYTDKYLQTLYDLKGSTIGREAKPGQAVKKDNDLRRRLPQGALALRPLARSRVREQIVTDCEFLDKMGVMDYSMLVGVHHIPHTDDRSIATSGFQGNRSSRRNLRLDDDSLGESLTSAPGNETIVSSPPKHATTSGVIDPLLGPGPPSPLRTTDSMRRRQLISDQIGDIFTEEGLDEDDSSYLLGSEHRPKSSASYNAESEWKKQQTEEKLYWPFHRLYDIHGHRRMMPISCPTCSVGPCCCHEEEDAKILAGYNIPKFVAPLSDRKDGGLEMDTEGFEMPMVYQRKNGPQLYGGKIFYMGIIDVLQEYTSRKVVEAKYRMVQTHGRLEASCVAPEEYGDRFISFFDEYTKGLSPTDVGVELNASGEVLGEADDDDSSLISC